MLGDAPVVDARSVLAAERSDLLDLLGSLTPREWSAPSAAPGWAVKDVALQLLDDDPGWLSLGRDRDVPGLLHERGHSDFIAALHGPEP